MYAVLTALAVATARDGSADGLDNKGVKRNIGSIGELIGATFHRLGQAQGNAGGGVRSVLSGVIIASLEVV